MGEPILPPQEQAATAHLQLKNRYIFHPSLSDFLSDGFSQDP